MKDKKAIILQQKDFIDGLRKKIQEFVASIDKTESETILLSGSLARGDYFP